MKHFIPKILAFTFLFLQSQWLFATHNRAGEILYKRIAPFTAVVGSTTVQVYTYSITLIKYTDGQALADRCVDTVYFGDGTKASAPRSNGTTTGCSCGSNTFCGEIIQNQSGYVVKKNIYSFVHTYTAAGSYLIRHFDPNRNAGIVNIPNSNNHPFYTESLMIVGPTLNTNSSPVLTRSPINRAALGSCFLDNPCAYDADGDSLSYEITTCKDQSGQTVTGYSFPSSGSSGSFGIDAVSGNLTWCNPQAVGEYAIAYIVKEWRKTSCKGSYQMIGYVLRDMQVLAQTANSVITFSLSGPQDTCVVAGTIVTKNFTGSIPANAATIDAEILGSAMITVNSPTPTLAPTSGIVTLTTVFTWSTNCSHVKKDPHHMFINFNVNAMGQSALKLFKIKVVPPAPQIYSITKDTSRVKLKWYPLSICQNSVANFNIYRKIGTNSWARGNCETGVPASSGYQHIFTAAATDSIFTDGEFNSIPSGSQANYIITAVLNNCAESFASSVYSVSLIVGINENTLSPGDLTVYPNPFNEDITIELKNHEPTDIIAEIYSIDGRLVLSKRMEDSQNVNLNTELLDSGAYFLRIRTGDGVIAQKIIKY